MIDYFYQFMYVSSVLIVGNFIFWSMCFDSRYFGLCFYVGQFGLYICSSRLFNVIMYGHFRQFGVIFGPFFLHID